MENQLFDSENIIAILGIQNLPDEQKVGIVEKVSELVQKRLLARILESLPPADKEEFMSVLQGQDQQPLNAFMDARVPNFLEWLQEEVRQVKNELKEWSENLQ